MNGLDFLFLSSRGEDVLGNGDGSPLSFIRGISEVLSSSPVKREQEKFSLHFWKSEWSWVWLVSISFCLLELIGNRGGATPFSLNHQRHHHYRLAGRTRITTTSTSLKAKGWLPPPSQHSPSGEKDYYYHLPKGSRMVTATTTTSTTTTTSINRTKLFYSPHALWRGLSLAAKMVPRERNFPILLLQWKGIPSYSML